MRPQASGGSQKGGDQAWRRKRSTPLRRRRGGRDPRICAPGNLKKLVKAVLWAKSSKDLLCDSHKARWPGVFPNWMSHAGVKEYFQTARGGPGVFSNWMSHAGVKEYFLIVCGTRVYRNIFELTVARGGRGVQKYQLSKFNGCPI